MTWILLLSVSLAWANDPINNGIVIENISIDEPTIRPPTVNVSASQKSEKFAADQNAKTQDKDSKSNNKGPATGDGSTADSNAGSAYLQPQENNDDEDRDEFKDSDDSADASKKKNPAY